jgi:hypothetical protein
MDLCVGVYAAGFGIDCVPGFWINRGYVCGWTVHIHNECVFGGKTCIFDETLSED